MSCAGDGVPTNVGWHACQRWLVCLPTVVGVPANGGWRACQRWLASQVTSTSIYSPASSHRKYKLFSPKKALLHIYRSGAVGIGDKAGAGAYPNDIINYIGQV